MARTQIAALVAAGLIAHIESASAADVPLRPNRSREQVVNHRSSVDPVARASYSSQSPAAHPSASKRAFISRFPRLAQKTVSSTVLFRTDGLPCAKRIECSLLPESALRGCLLIRLFSRAGPDELTARPLHFFVF
jgi:hypothetical protein